MSCDVLSCDELSSVVKWCGAMGWDLMSLWCIVAGCDVTLCGSKWLCGVNWKMIWWSELHRSTPYYTVLLRYYSVLHSTTLHYKSTNSVLQSTTPVLLCTRKVLLQYYSSTILYYTVLLCTTKYYSSTTPYYKVLLQYYAVPQSTTPVLFCTTKYYSSTTLYYKVLLQYHSVLQRTTPVLVCTTKYYSSITLYYKVLLQYYSVLQSSTPVLVCNTMRRATGLILQPHQILRLPRKMTLMIDVRHTWHVIYNAQSNRSHPPTSPSAAPATQNDSHHLSRDIWNVIYNARRNRHDPPTSPNTAPATQNDSHDWSSSHIKRHLQCAEQQISSSNITKCCACHAKWLASSILVTYETSFTMRGATGITLQPHQILRLPRKIALQNQRNICRKRLKRQFQCGDDSSMIRMIEHGPTMNSSSRTRPRRGYFSRFRDAFVLKITTFRAPAIYSNFTEYCACHEKWPSNLTKCCPCHEKWCASLIVVAYETSFTMRGATGITLQPRQILRLPRKIAFQNQRNICRKRLKRQFQCGDDSSMIRPAARSPRLFFALGRRIPDLPIDPCRRINPL